MEADWSSLPRDLLVTIAKLTSLVLEDFMAFRSTCASWNEAGGDDECLKSACRVPFLMIPDRAKFYSLSRKKSFSMRSPLPESRCRLSRKKTFSKRAPAPEAKCPRKFMESRFGWVLAHAPSGEVDLLYPFSGERIQLPDFQTIDEYHHHDRPRHWVSTYDPFIRCSVLSANPSQASDYVLVVVSAFHMSCWRPGDRNWTGIGSAKGAVFADVIFCIRDHKFYAVAYNNTIWVWDMVSNSAVLAMAFPSSYQPLAPKKIIFNTNLVESSSTGELLLVRYVEVTHHRHYEVHRLDVTRGELERVKTRLKDAIFLGANASFSILPDDNDPVIHSNCIYFTPQVIHRPDSDHNNQFYWFKNKEGIVNGMGIYNLENESIQRFPPFADSLCFFTSPPIWVAPSSLSFMAY